MYIDGATRTHARSSRARISPATRTVPPDGPIAWRVTPRYVDGLDYFQEENVKKRKEYGKTIAPYCEVAAHLTHAPALPLALLDALTLSASGHARPGVVDLVGGYILFYMAQTLVNHVATQTWQYPIIADAQRAAGWPGVLLFFAAIAGLMIGAGLLGVVIVGFA